MTVRTETRIIVLDEQQMFADIIQGLINAEPDLGVVATLTDPHRLSNAVHHHDPDVIVIDHDIAGDASAIARQIRADRPSAQVLMLMHDPSTAATRDAVEAGCLGVVGKDRSAADLLSAIRTVARGQAVAAISNLEAIFGIADPRAVDAPDLTTRQLEILTLMAQGCSTDAIAEQLFVSRTTIRSHMHQILTKLDARSKLEAVAIARRNRLI